MANLTSTRVIEMLSDLDDFETEFNQFEQDFLQTIRDNLDKYEDKFRLIGKQQETLEKIYDRYCKKPQY